MKFKAVMDWFKGTKQGSETLKLDGENGNFEHKSTFKSLFGLGILMEGATGGNPASGKINGKDFEINGASLNTRIGNIESNVGDIPATITTEINAKLKTYESSEQTIISAGAKTFTHGLGGFPTVVQPWLICKVAENGYSIGDEILAPLIEQNGTTGASYNIIVEATATQIKTRYGNNTNAFYLSNKTTGAAVAATNGNWKLIMRAFRVI